MRHKIKTGVAWVLAILLAIGFLFFGGVKLTSNPAMIREFEQIGFGQWLRYFTGGLEVVGAIGVLIPRFRFCAALQLAIVMAGATLTNLVILHVPPVAGVTTMLMALALALAWLRRPINA